MPALHASAHAPIIHQVDLVPLLPLPARPVVTSSYLLAACRTPIGKLGGALGPLTAPEMAAAAIGQAIRRAELDAAAVDEVILGNVLSAGVGQAPARQAALAAGLPPTVGAATVGMVCGSGLRAVMLADQAIRAGDAEVIVAGGMESMSRAPYLLPGARQGWKFGDQPAIDSMLYDGLRCAFEKCAMGDEADYIASAHSVSRADQDAFALESHRRAVAATAAGQFVDEIVPRDRADRQNAKLRVERDEGPRADTNARSARPAEAGFQRHGHGHGRQFIANQRRGGGRGRGLRSDRPARTTRR